MLLGLCPLGLTREGSAWIVLIQCESIGGDWAHLVLLCGLDLILISVILCRAPGNDGRGRDRLERGPQGRGSLGGGGVLGSTSEIFILKMCLFRCFCIWFLK